MKTKFVVAAIALMLLVIGILGGLLISSRHDAPEVHTSVDDTTSTAALAEPTVGTQNGMNWDAFGERDGRILRRAYSRIDTDPHKVNAIAFFCIAWPTRLENERRTLNKVISNMVDTREMTEREGLLVSEEFAAHQDDVVVANVNTIVRWVSKDDLLLISTGLSDAKSRNDRDVLAACDRFSRRSKEVVAQLDQNCIDNVKDIVRRVKAAR